MAGTAHARVALVTGGLGAIGTAVISALAHDGNVAVAADRDARRPDDVLLDVRSRESCHAAIESVIRKHGRLDTLVNCAGVNVRGSTADVPERAWTTVLDINLHGVIRMCQAAFPALQASSGATVVNISSVAGLVAIDGTAVYGASKAAVSHFTAALAVEWARYGIRVNAVAPTLVPSAMTADVLDDPRYMAAKLASIPLSRVATPQDVAAAVSWLAGPRSAMTTGISLPVDGGASLL